MIWAQLVLSILFLVFTSTWVIADQDEFFWPIWVCGLGLAGTTIYQVWQGGLP